VLIASLARVLPEDFSVFDSGTTKDGLARITIRQVISRAEVLAHVEEILAAAREFRHTARTLVRRLAEKLAVPLDAVWKTLLRTQAPQADALEPHRNYYF